MLAQTSGAIIHFCHPSTELRDENPPALVKAILSLFDFLDATLIEEIARGGMGVVYSARDDRGQMVALKVMRESRDRLPGVAERFRCEAEVLAQVRHPNIVQIHQLGQHGEQLFLVMDFGWCPSRIVTF